MMFHENCPECGGAVGAYRGEAVCTDCGLVIGPLLLSPQFVSPPWRHRGDRIRNAKEKRVSRALAELSSLSRDLPPSVKRLAEVFVAKSAELYLAKRFGLRKLCLVAIALAKRIHELPLSQEERESWKQIKELAAVCGVKLKFVSPNDELEHVFTSFIQLFGSLNRDILKDVYLEARELCTLAWKLGFVGSPKNIAVAALIIAMKRRGMDLRIDKVSKALGVSRSSVVNFIKKLENLKSSERLQVAGQSVSLSLSSSQRTTLFSPPHRLQAVHQVQ